MDDRCTHPVYSSTVTSTDTPPSTSLDQQVLIEGGGDQYGDDEYGASLTRDTILPASVLLASVVGHHSIDAPCHPSQASQIPTLLHENPVQVLQDGQSLLELGLTHLQNQCYSDALAALDRALSCYTLVDARDGQAKVLSLITWATYSNGDYQNSIILGQRTLVLANELDQHAIAIEVLGTIGNAYRHLGNTDRASHFQHESLALAQKIGDHRGSMAALNNLGLVFKATQDYAQAIFYEKQALVLARSLHDQSVEAQVLKNLGNAYYAIGESETAIDYYKERLVLVRSMENPRLEIQVLKHLSIASYSIGKPTEAIDYTRDRLNLLRALKDVVGEEQALRSMAIFHESLGQSYEAVEVHQCRLIVARVLGNASLFLEVQADLKRLFCNLGAFDLAHLVSQESLIWGEG